MTIERFYWPQIGGGFYLSQPSFSGSIASGDFSCRNHYDSYFLTSKVDYAVLSWASDRLCINYGRP